jgi:hypothetical protein
MQFFATGVFFVPANPAFYTSFFVPFLEQASRFSRDWLMGSLMEQFEQIPYIFTYTFYVLKIWQKCFFYTFLLGIVHKFVRCFFN